MRSLTDIRIRFYRNLPLFIGICLSLYFSYHSIYGHRSYSNLLSLTFSLEQRVGKLSVLEQSREKIKNKVVMMRPDSLSVDMFDEQVRYVLGYRREGEIVIIDN